MNKILKTQIGLSLLCLYSGALDGLRGGKTRTAQKEFVELNRIFPDEFESKLLETINNFSLYDYSDKESLALAVANICKLVYVDDKRVWAYIMATVQHETNAEYMPVEEAGYLSPKVQMGYLRKKSYYPYYGRGLPQLTHDYNYRKYGLILTLPLLEHPEIALEKPISLFILIHGIITGGFTGRSITRYIHDEICDYKQARRTVNGMDKAELIAGYAQEWEAYYTNRTTGE